MPFQFGKEKAFQSWKSSLYLISSSRCQCSYSKARKPKEGKKARFWSWKGSGVTSMERKSLSSLGKICFQAWKSCLYLDLLVSSSHCQSSFCEARKERRLLFEVGKVLEFPVWKENILPIWKFKLLNLLLGTSQPYLRNLKQLSSALVHLYTLGLLCLQSSFPLLW